MVNKMAKTKTRDDAENYWVRREAKAREKSQSDDSDKSDVVKRIFEYMFHNVTEQINAWYSKYASKEGISMSEAKKRADKLDIKAYEEKAKKYVKEKNFSQQANDEMKIYNLTMKANRLELLKSEVALELAAGNDEYEKYVEDCLKDKTIDEMERQAGILGKTIKNNGDMIKSIVNASFYNATFSERIWANQDMLRSELEGYMTKAIIQGKSTNSLISDMRKRFYVSYYAADRLLRTEERRIQTDVAKRSYEENGFGQYKYVIMNTKACDECRKLDGNIYDTKDMTPGVNAPPMHPICYCSTVPYIDRKLFDEYLDDPDSGDMTFEEWKKEKNNIDFMGSKIVDVISDRGNSITYHTSDINSKIHRQTYSKNSQKMEMLLDEYLTKNELDTNTFILKYSDLGGMSAYDHVSDKFYIAEELCDKNKFRQMVGDRFPAKNIEDVMTHEFEGHKNHWDAVKRYTKNHPKLSEDEAKIELESNLRKYVSQQNNRDISYISNVISENAKYGFDVNNSLNELIADAIVLVDQDNLSDKELEKLIKGVIEYDG